MVLQQQRQQMLDMLVAWLLEESEKHPVLAMWEDLHWADPSTLEMLSLVLEQTPTVPMLHVLTFRPEFTSPWPTRSHMIPITLNRLERPQVEALITHLTDNMTLPEEVVEHIVTKTDGVPLYVEELTKMLLASDLLRKEADQYVLTGNRNHVLTFRPEFTSPWPTRSHMIPITLNRLERPQVEALITHLTDNMTLPEEVVEHIVTKTDGVPLYVEELTKMLLASDLLRKEADQYVLTGPLSTVTIPDTLQDSLMARLDQMDNAKEVAQIGAVLGRAFTYEMLQAIASQDEETVQVNLAQLVEAELLYQRGRPPWSRYIFKHALIQDAAYASLLRSTRQHVHQQIAQLLEGQFPGIALPTRCRIR